MSENAEPVVTSEVLLPERATSDGTLRRIHEAALLSFGQLGYHGVSIRDLGRAAGIQPSTLYAHVKSKEQLLFDLVQLAHVEHRAQVEQAVMNAGPDPADQLRAFMHAHVSMHATYRMLARVANRELAALSADNELIVRAVREESVRLLEGILSRGSRLGVFTVHDPFLTAAAIGAMGLRVAEWWEPGASYTAEQVGDYYAELAVRMVIAPGLQSDDKEPA
jgi:AcrR family transcriptional regulator